MDLKISFIKIKLVAFRPIAHVTTGDILQISGLISGGPQLQIENWLLSIRVLSIQHKFLILAMVIKTGLTATHTDFLFAFISTSSRDWLQKVSVTLHRLFIRFNEADLLLSFTAEQHRLIVLKKAAICIVLILALAKIAAAYILAGIVQAMRLFLTILLSVA